MKALAVIEPEVCKDVRAQSSKERWQGVLAGIRGTYLKRQRDEKPIGNHGIAVSQSRPT